MKQGLLRLRNVVEGRRTKNVTLFHCHLQELIRLYRPSRTLRSSTSLRLRRTSHNLKSYGPRAFAVASPQLWNDLPIYIRKSDNLHIFKTRLQTRLKTPLFKEVFLE